MRILWVTNKVIPIVNKAMGENSSTAKEGWLAQTFDQLCSDNEFEMCIVCNGAKRRDKGRYENFNWYSVESNIKYETDYNVSLQNHYSNILKEFTPDIIHIWGSEYPHTLAMMRAAQAYKIEDKCIISIQGVISAIANHYLSELPPSVINKKSFFERIRKCGLKDLQKRFIKRGKYEIEALRIAKHVIGRTEWDKRCSTRINPILRYHLCNETLREDFYTDSWDYEKCQKHSIFLSQATYPIKGFHVFMKALPNLVARYPDLHVYVTGNDVIARRTLIQRFKASTYSEYLRSFIEKNSLKNHITFLGTLDSRQMKEQYLNANVFVSPSLIENSPNSVGEAMLLGCPVVCSDVGGTRTIIKDGAEGYTYPSTEYYTLESLIASVFERGKDIIDITNCAKQHAKITHSPQKNYNRLVTIYKEMLLE